MVGSMSCYVPTRKDLAENCNDPFALLQRTLEDNAKLRERVQVLEKVLMRDNIGIPTTTKDA